MYGRGGGTYVEPIDRPELYEEPKLVPRFGIPLFAPIDACAAEPIDGARAPTAVAELGVAYCCARIKPA